MKIIEGNRVPIKIWADNIEDDALKQAQNLANLPFAFKHIAIMPDVHTGYGMPIGGVLATNDVIIPNAVGVDIGCGMCAVKTSLDNIDKDKLKEIINRIKMVVPLGFEHHKKKQSKDLMPQFNGDIKNSIVEQEYESALTQIGTLGGGNHFIEIQKGSDNHIWIMLHSGSRNIGLKVASHYNRLAVSLNEKWKSPVPRQWQLAYLPVDDKEGEKYIQEMRFCVDFAFANRKLMMDRIKELFFDIMKGKIEFDEMINIAHNYAALEKHFGKMVWVHRKGATLATEDTIGIIPGSQGTPSYITRGKGNPESFMSSSHGAGRIMGRNRARKELELNKEIEKLESKGIIHSIRSKRDLDEAPSCYKDIDEVMENQKDLVEVVLKLEPLAVIKG